MKHRILLFLLLFSILTYSQSDKISTNDSLIVEYVNDFVYEANIRDIDIKEKLTSKIDYILIASPKLEIKDLGISYKDDKVIMLSNNVRLDRLILRATLYRELAYMLNVPYGGNVIMNRERDEWFSYALFSNPDIMRIEMDRIMSFLKIM